MSETTKKRFSDALSIANGACNPSGIALSIVDACREARAEGKVAHEDAAVKLMVSQLAYLCGIWNGISDWGGSPTSQWENLWSVCVEVSKGEKERP